MVAVSLKKKRIKNRKKDTIEIKKITDISDISGMDAIPIIDKFIMASQLYSRGVKSKLVHDIVIELEGTIYISPKGASDYIYAENILNKANFELAFFNYQHPIYNQMFGNFEAYLSILDLLFNCGKKSLDILCSGILELEPVKDFN